MPAEEQKWNLLKSEWDGVQRDLGDLAIRLADLDRHVTELHHSVTDRFVVAERSLEAIIALTKQQADALTALRTDTETTGTEMETRLAAMELENTALQETWIPTVEQRIGDLKTMAEAQGRMISQVVDRITTGEGKGEALAKRLDALEATVEPRKEPTS